MLTQGHLQQAKKPTNFLIAGHSSFCNLSTETRHPFKGFLQTLYNAIKKGVHTDERK